MKQSASTRVRSAGWRSFSRRDGARIDAMLRAGETPRCPRCGDRLEEQDETRLAPPLLLDETAYDLVCSGCRRLRCIIQHTPRSMRLIRMRRLAAAVREVNAGQTGRLATR